MNEDSIVWLTVAQVAKYWGRTPRLVRYWCNNGTLVAFGAKVQRVRNTHPMSSTHYYKWLIGFPREELHHIILPETQEETVV